MKIGIHNSKNSFSADWIKYCESNNINYKIVDCYESNIIEQIADCDILMWHYHHKAAKDSLIARQLLFALEVAGKVVYPDFMTSWFFDDKIGQKYLLEAIGAPLVPTHIFLSKKEALNWIEKTSFPKVFKLRKGAGSANVILLKTKRKAARTIRKAFSSGFRQYNPWGGLKERWRLFKQGHSDYLDLIEGIGRIFIKTKFEKITGREKGYVYFQDFIDGCSYDIRTTVIGNKCYALKRMVRENDFRASGSHNELHDPHEIPIEIIKMSFNISEKLNLQSAAFDFILTRENKPLITELSYAFGWDEGDNNFFWDSDLNLYQKSFNVFGEMVENLIRKVKTKI